jgi:hypothetical protein
MEGKNLLEFRNNFHKFRNSIKFSMNFYRFKLALARLKLTDISDTRYIYFIFLEPGTDQNLHEKIYFTIFWHEFISLQIFEVCSIFESKPKRKTKPDHLGRLHCTTQWHSTVRPFCAMPGMTRLHEAWPTATPAQRAWQPTGGWHALASASAGGAFRLRTGGLDTAQVTVELGVWRWAMSVGSTAMAAWTRGVGGSSGSSPALASW